MKMEVELKIPIKLEKPGEDRWSSWWDDEIMTASVQDDGDEDLIELKIHRFPEDPVKFKVSIEEIDRLLTMLKLLKSADG